MKKIIFFIVSLFVVWISFATNPCNKIVLQQENGIGQAKFASNIRTYPCTYKSSVLRASKIWEKFNIVWKVSGWYKIQLSNWQIAWIWDKSVNIVWSSYNLTEKDKLIIEKVNQKIDKLVEKKWESFRLKLENALVRLLPRYTSNPRIYSILDKLLEHTKKIKIQDKQEIKKNENKVEQKLDTKQSKQTQVQVDNDYWNFYFDEKKVRQTWLNLHNAERKKMWLKAYVYNSKLDNTAKDRSETMKFKKIVDHRRHKWDSYYDYWKIAKWFEQRWVVCQNISRATFSESIGYYTTKCDKSDCTDSVIKWLENTFNFYMSEKWKKWRPHYNGIVHKLFTQIWFGIAIENRWNGWYRYYFTTHYCTKIVK